jgi:hypothetical protein
MHPRASLEAFFEAQECPLHERLSAIGPEEDYAGPVIKAVDELSDEEHARLTVTAERIAEMATEFGQAALLAVVEDRLLVEELENAYDRSLWVFLNEPTSFRRAEEIRHTDQHRQGRMWSGYEGPKGITPDTSPGAVAAFRGAAQELFGSLEAYCEIYRRTRANLEAPDSELHQLTLYHDDLPDTYLEFHEQRLVRRHRRPVVEVSMSTAERKCIGVAAQRCIRWGDDQGPARGPGHLAVRRAAVGWRRSWASAGGACFAGDDSCHRSSRGCGRDG